MRLSAVFFVRILREETLNLRGNKFSRFGRYKLLAILPIKRIPDKIFIRFHVSVAEQEDQAFKIITKIIYASFP